MPKSVKLSDIARIAGVSTVTVSNALAGKKGVSDEMRLKIRKIAGEIGYKTLPESKREHNQYNFTIGILIADSFLGKYDSFYWQMYQAVTTKAVSEGCFTMLELVTAEAERHHVMPKFASDKRVDGIIVIGQLNHDYLEEMRKEIALPLIYLDFYDNFQGCDAVISNSFYGTYALTNYLFDKGHKKIAYVGTLMVTQSITDRYFGYCRSMMEHGAAVRPEWIINDRDEENRVNETDLFRMLPSPLPTAFVCNCDLTAAILIRALQEHGVRVPEDVSVVGFDNFLYPWFCKTGITTYESDLKEMSNLAVGKMIKKLMNREYKPGIIIADGRLIEKESVASVNS